MNKPPSPQPPISQALIAEHGLSDEEYQRIVDDMGRTPHLTELGVFSVMWSEHCSYKSSRAFLRHLPTEAPHVIQGPGENAGVIDIGDNDAIIFKMESHNHPSFIEPYQGAATGVGGIMRDVFTMGARPIANLNALRFGSPDHPKTRHLLAGVVAGIGGYGNCTGVPTVGGEVNFDASYNGNILVNAMCVGHAKRDRIFYARATGIGNLVVYVGAKTGRDGIHGATMASAEFADDSEAKRPTVQVGDPFTEKLLLEACLELMESDSIIAIQDMGAAGLTSSSVEMADKGGVGIELELDKVPCRETGMTAYEMLLSESQERMLMVLKPDCEAIAEEIFKKWDLDFAIIGRLTDTRHFVARHQGVVEADIPIKSLAEGAPIYERPQTRTLKRVHIAPGDVTAPQNYGATLKAMLGGAALASRHWVWEQYDYEVMGDTIIPPGGDAALIRIHGTAKGLAIATDVTPRYCLADPVEGGKQAVAETYRNICAIGGLPLAITNCLNFGNPERPDIMGQFVGCLEGITQACEALDYPVVSGNVSLYNETNGVGILPTPAIGGVGLLQNYTQAAHLALAESGHQLFVIGETKGHLGCSLYMRDVMGKNGDALGAPPPVDLMAEKIHGTFIRTGIQQGLFSAVHDVSDGGLLIALAEMALAGGVGFEVKNPSAVADHAFWFGEDQARYVVALPPAQAAQFTEKAQEAGIMVALLGQSGGVDLTLSTQMRISLEEIKRAHRGWFAEFMRA